MRLRLLALFVLLVVFAVRGDAQGRSLDIYFVDVEGGAATLIVTPAGESVLIDCGSPGPRDAGRIAAAAYDAGLKAIDHLIATHWHSDHFGGTPDLARLLPIKHFYNRGIPPSLNDEPQLYPQMIRAYRQVTADHYTVLKPGETVPLKTQPGTPAVRLLTLCGTSEFLPDRPGAASNSVADEHVPKEADPSDNAKSLGFLLSFGGFRFLDLGDLTWNMEYRLVHPTDKIGPVEVYLTTHHGLEISNNPVIIKTVRPRVAIFNNGPYKGGHPDVTHTLRAVPDLQAIYQLHRNLGASDADNAPAGFIANSEEHCRGEYIKLSVASDSRSYTVTVGRSGAPRRYRTRMAPPHP